tara:strand:+ start:4372 stop:5880 length:1509 start_codon:yes stop_codon:yes gene_type:complete
MAGFKCNKDDITPIESLAAPMSYTTRALEEECTPTGFTSRVVEVTKCVDVWTGADMTSDTAQDGCQAPLDFPKHTMPFNLAMGLPLTINHTPITPCSNRTQPGTTNPRGANPFCDIFQTAMHNDICDKLLPSVPNPDNPPEGVKCQCQRPPNCDPDPKICKQCNPGDPQGCPRTHHEMDPVDQIGGVITEDGLNPMIQEYTDNIADLAKGKACRNFKSNVRFQARTAVANGEAPVSVICKKKGADGGIVTPFTSTATATIDSAVVLEGFTMPTECVVNIEDIFFSAAFPANTPGCIQEGKTSRYNRVTREVKTTGTTKCLVKIDPSGTRPDNCTNKFNFPCPQVNYKVCGGFEVFEPKRVKIKDENSNVVREIVKWETRNSILQTDLFPGGATTVGDLACMQAVRMVGSRIPHLECNGECTDVQIDNYISNAVPDVFATLKVLVSQVTTAFEALAGKAQSKLQRAITTRGEELVDLAMGSNQYCECHISNGRPTITIDYAGG